MKSCKRQARIAARTQHHRRRREEEEDEKDEHSSSSSSTSEEDEEEDCDEALAMLKFKEDCWQELESSAVAAGVARLTGEGEQQTGGGENSIIVSIRIRPPRATEGLDNQPIVTNKGNEIRVQKPSYSGGSKEKHSFAFDYTFNGSSRQLDVFKAMGWPCVRSAWNGINISIFAYGQTGAVGLLHFHRQCMGSPAANAPFLVRASRTP